MKPQNRINIFLRRREEAHLKLIDHVVDDGLDEYIVGDLNEFLLTQRKDLVEFLFARECLGQ